MKSHFLFQFKNLNDGFIIIEITNKIKIDNYYKELAQYKI